MTADAGRSGAGPTTAPTGTEGEGPGSARFHCSDAARGRDDAFFATAPPARRWLLVEHGGPWGHQPLHDAGFAPEVLAAIDAFCRARGARFQLIRRTAARGVVKEDHGRFALVETSEGQESVRWGRVDDPADLPAALADLEGCTQVSDEPVYLICAHGRHDACCARRGRPVAAVLAAAHPTRTWETTHTGGDRFAANVVLLPHGFVLGQVPATEVLEIAARYDKGEIDTRQVRGRSSLAPPAQAAQHHARLAFDEADVDAFGPRGMVQRDDGLWSVRLDGGADRGIVTVVLREQWISSPTPLTCSALRAASMRTFELVSLSADAGGAAT